MEALAAVCGREVAEGARREGALGKRRQKAQARYEEEIDPDRLTEFEQGFDYDESDYDAALGGGMGSDDDLGAIDGLAITRHSCESCATFADTFAHDALIWDLPYKWQKTLLHQTFRVDTRCNFCHLNSMPEHHKESCAGVQAGGIVCTCKHGRLGPDGTIIPCYISAQPGGSKSVYHAIKNCNGSSRSSETCPQRQGAALGRASTQANPSRPRRGTAGTGVAPPAAQPRWGRGQAGAAAAPAPRPPLGNTQSNRRPAAAAAARLAVEAHRPPRRRRRDDAGGHDSDEENRGLTLQQQQDLRPPTRFQPVQAPAANGHGRGGKKAFGGKFLDGAASVGGLAADIQRVGAATTAEDAFALAAAEFSMCPSNSRFSALVNPTTRLAKEQPGSAAHVAAVAELEKYTKSVTAQLNKKTGSRAEDINWQDDLKERWPDAALEKQSCSSLRRLAQAYPHVVKFRARIAANLSDCEGFPRCSEILCGPRRSAQDNGVLQAIFGANRRDLDAPAYEGEQDYNRPRGPARRGEVKREAPEIISLLDDSEDDQQPQQKGQRQRDQQQEEQYQQQQVQQHQQQQVQQHRQQQEQQHRQQLPEQPLPQSQLGQGRRLGGTAHTALLTDPAALRRTVADAAERRAALAEPHGQVGQQTLASGHASDGGSEEVACPQAPGSGNSAAGSHMAGSALASAIAAVKFHPEAASNMDLQQRYLSILDDQAVNLAALKHIAEAQDSMSQFWNAKPAGCRLQARSFAGLAS